jgi:hypothetical protein
MIDSFSPSNAVPNQIFGIRRSVVAPPHGCQELRIVVERRTPQPEALKAGRMHALPARSRSWHPLSASIPKSSRQINAGISVESVLEVSPVEAGSSPTPDATPPRATPQMSKLLASVDALPPRETKAVFKRCVALRDRHCAIVQASALGFTVTKLYGPPTI